MSSTQAAPTTSHSLTPPRVQAPLVLLAGNPNTGKTTLFNRLTGQNARVGNYPGVTVERRSGRMLLELGAGQSTVEVVDAPGAYSLSARSAEEQVLLQAVLGLNSNPEPDLCVLVIDAGQLSRNLYLLVQLAELRVPLVVAMNMIDEVADNPPSAARLSEVFGVPCVATQARTGRGIPELKAAIARALEQRQIPNLRLEYPAALDADVAEIVRVLPAALRSDPARERALALWALTSVEPDDELESIDPELRARCLELRAREDSRDRDLELIATRYALIDAELPRLYEKRESRPRSLSFSDRVDRVLLHPVYGFAIFVSVMLLVFQSLFSWADPAISLIENGMALFANAIVARVPPSLGRDLITEGVLGGVGNVLVFLPQILLLFLFIGLLEDSGYMARVAYLMDRVMKALGLHGRAFVPMLSGFACAVPAILATRTMERRRDRLLTMLVVPLMTCSARLPVYTLIIGTLFPVSRLGGVIPVQGLMMMGMYVFSAAVSLLAAGVLGRSVVRGRRMPLLLELPPYRLPAARVLLRQMGERALVFLKEAGTIILACSIVLWALLSFPRTGDAESPRAPDIVQEAADPALPSGSEPPSLIEQSYGGRLGKAIEPLLEPLGFDWKIGVGIIGAFAAREVFISTLGLVYGIGDSDEAVDPLRDQIRNERRSDGRPVYTPLSGLSLMLFFALSCQCMSTLAVVRRETKSWRWPAFLFTYMTGLAYLVSLLVYQGGKLLGFE